MHPMCIARCGGVGAGGGGGGGLRGGGGGALGPSAHRGWAEKSPNSGQLVPPQGDRVTHIWRPPCRMASSIALACHKRLWLCWGS
jgi:hypothetical protein